MSAYLKFSYDIEYDGTYNTCRMDLYVDTAADLAGLAFFDGIKLLPGSTAHDIATGDLYMLNGSGSWIKQPGAGAFDNVYTKSEIDSMILDIDNDITGLETQDNRTLAALSDLINENGKNAAQINTASDTLRLIIDLDIPAGDYVLTIADLQSTDTDTSVCLITIYDSNNNTIYSGGATRGTDKVINLTLNAAASKIYIYASDNYSHSSGDTVSITDLMICKKHYWGITEDYEVYCPTLPKLYSLFVSELSGINTLIGGGI